MSFSEIVVFAKNCMTRKNIKTIFFSFFIGILFTAALFFSVSIINDSEDAARKSCRSSVERALSLSLRSAFSEKIPLDNHWQELTDAEKDLLFDFFGSKGQDCGRFPNLSEGRSSEGRRLPIFA